MQSGGPAFGSSRARRLPAALGFHPIGVETPVYLGILGGILGWICKEHRWALLALGVVLAAGVSAPGRAAESADADSNDEDGEGENDRTRDLFALSLEDLLALEVVTGSTADRTQAVAPSNLLVITREVMLRRGYRSLSDLMDDLPGIEVHHGSNVEWDHVVLVRGQKGNAKFIVLQDGVRINAISGTPHSIGRNYSLANAERVEVLLGPASALYGADAFAGVINIITRGGEAIGGVEARASYGMYNTTDDVLVAGFREGPVEVALTGSFYYSDDPNLAEAYPDQYAWYHDRYLTDGVVLAAPGSDELVSVGIEPWATPNLTYYVNGTVEIADRFRVGYTRHSDRHSSSVPVAPEFTLYTADARWEYAIQSFFAEHEYVGPRDKLRLLSTLSIGSYRTNPRSQYLNNFAGYGVAGYKYEQHLAGRFEQRVSYRFLDRLAACVGVTYEDFSGQPKSADLTHPYDPDVASDAQDQIYAGTDIDDVDGNDLSVPVDFFEYRYQNIGAYAELDARPLDWLALLVGLRFDHNTRYGNNLAPRASVVLTPSGTTRIKLMYGEAFLAPAPYNTYQHFGSFAPVTDEDGNVTGLQSYFWWIPNPDLQPERLRTAELSFSQSIAGIVQLDLSGYYTHVRDLMVGAPTELDSYKGWPAGLVYHTTNGGSAHFWGGSVGAQAQLSSGIVRVEPHVSYVLTAGEIDGDPLPIAAMHGVKGGVDVGIQRFSISLRAIYRSRARHEFMSDDDGVPLSIPASVVVNGHLRYSELVRSKRFTLSPWVDVKNLLDARYTAFADTTILYPGAPQDPIRVVGGVDLSF